MMLSTHDRSYFNTGIYRIILPIMTLTILMLAVDGCGGRNETEKSSYKYWDGNRPDSIAQAEQQKTEQDLNHRLIIGGAAIVVFLLLFAAGLGYSKNLKEAYGNSARTLAFSEKAAYFRRSFFGHLGTGVPMVFVGLLKALDEALRSKEATLNKELRYHLGEVANHVNEDDKKRLLRMSIDERLAYYAGLKQNLPPSSSPAQTLDTTAPASTTETNRPKPTIKETREHELDEFANECQHRTNLKRIRENIEGGYQGERRERKFSEFLNMLKAQQEVIRRIDADTSLSPAEKEEARRTAEVIFIKQLEEFERGL